MHLLCLKLLTYRSIFVRLMHNGLIFFIPVSNEKLSISFFISAICKHIRYYYFIDVYIIYSYWIFGITKLFLFSFITIECQELLDNLSYNILRIKYFLIGLSSGVFLLADYFCLQVIVLIPKKIVFFKVPSRCIIHYCHI